MPDFAWEIEREGKRWRRGVTTGACAAAAAKAAIYALVHQQAGTSVEIVTPHGIPLRMAVSHCRVASREASCAVRKDAGDDPDITHGILIFATVSWQEKEGIVIEGGTGVGRVTKPGLQIPVGQAAINPVPRSMIQSAVQEYLPPGGGCKVVIHVPEGERLAMRTLNPALGIEGGISILGTTGIVEPMSEEAYKYALVPQIDIALAGGFDTLVFTPGKIGGHMAARYHIAAEAIVLTSNFIGYMLCEAASRGVKNILLFGHLGKLVKVAGGIFHTHSKTADGRMETMAAYAAAQGASAEVVRSLLECVTTEAALGVLQTADLTGVCNILAERASWRAGRYIQQKCRVGTVMVSMEGKIVGIDKNAREIGGAAGWQLG